MSPRDNVHFFTWALSLFLQLQRGCCSVVLHWLPSHAGVQRDEDADAAAKLATLLQDVTSPIDNSISIKLLLRSASYTPLQVDLAGPPGIH